MNKSLREYLKCLPHFLLFNYPKKMQAYKKAKEYNNTHEEKIPLNSYYSPSPLNELCDYVDTWEKKKIVWDRTAYDTRCLILDNSLDLSDKKVIREVRHLISDFVRDLRKVYEIQGKQDLPDHDFDFIINFYKQKVENLGIELNIDRFELDNYIIYVSYSNPSYSKLLAWAVCGDTLLNNLKSNTPNEKQTSIIKVGSPTLNSYEYLGKYYEMLER